jgi:hypothetical protein
MSERVLYLDRPAFWTEFRDPECWLRALRTLTALQRREGGIHGGPDQVWNEHLKRDLSRRAMRGMWGVHLGGKRPLLMGVGFLQRDGKAWRVTEEAAALADGYHSDQATAGFRQLAVSLMKSSPWLRLMILRLQRSEWELANWSKVRGTAGKFLVGKSLILHNHDTPDTWFTGVETQSLGIWKDKLEVDGVAIEPGIMTRKADSDQFAWTPLKSPLYLLDFLGWLSDKGIPEIPDQVLADAGLIGEHETSMDPSSVLQDYTAHEADLRGFVPIEFALRRIYKSNAPDIEDFAAWMDAVMQAAIDRGAIEILAAEPGQSRHGRGLFGDRQRKLVKWVIHEDFNDCLAGIERQERQDPNGAHLTQHTMSTSEGDTDDR